MIDVLIDGAGPALGLVAAIAGVGAVKFGRDWFRAAPAPARRGNRIPDNERCLLGDDWRDCLR